jgi:hypothetical protein
MAFLLLRSTHRFDCGQPLHNESISAWLTGKKTRACMEMFRARVIPVGVGTNILRARCLFIQRGRSAQARR